MRRHSSQRMYAHIYKTRGTEADDDDRIPIQRQSQFTKSSRE